jgi:hypothetical protein
MRHHDRHAPEVRKLKTRTMRSVMTMASTSLLMIFCAPGIWRPRGGPARPSKTFLQAPLIRPTQMDRQMNHSRLTNGMVRRQSKMPFQKVWQQERGLDMVIGRVKLGGGCTGKDRDSYQHQHEATTFNELLHSV